MSTPFSETHSPVLEVRGLNKRFARLDALTEVSFSAFRGEILGLIGPNGAGKTTLLECVCGLLPTNGGEVLSGGRVLSGNGQRLAMFYVPEGIIPYPEQTVRHVLALFAAVYRRREQGVREVVDALGLSPVLNQPVGQLSKGGRRRLLVAIGLLTPQPVLLMDEAFDGFDLRQTRDAIKILRDVAAGADIDPFLASACRCGADLRPVCAVVEWRRQPARGRSLNCGSRHELKAAAWRRFSLPSPEQLSSRGAPFTPLVQKEFARSCTRTRLLGRRHDRGVSDRLQLHSSGPSLRRGQPFRGSCPGTGERIIAP